MTIDRLQASIQRQNEYIDKKYKTAGNLRRAVSAGAGALVLGAGYLGAKSISKEKSVLRDGIAGASDFVLKHTANAVKKIDKKDKLAKVSGLLQKAKNAPAKTKALAVFGLFIGNAMLNLVKKNSYLKGVFNQAKADEKAFKTAKAFENEAVSIAQENKLVEESLEVFAEHMFKAPDVIDADYREVEEVCEKTPCDEESCEEASED